MKTKHCNQCRKEKAPEEFYKDSSAKDGRHSTCITCSRKTGTRAEVMFGDVLKKFLGVPVPQTIPGRIYDPHKVLGRRNSGAMKPSD